MSNHPRVAQSGPYGELHSYDCLARDSIRTYFARSYFGTRRDPDHARRQISWEERGLGVVIQS
jgi:hypothetical protein